MNNGLADRHAAFERALDAIGDPETGRGLVESGRIKGLAQDAKGRVSFTIEAPSGLVERYGPIRDAAEVVKVGQKVQVTVVEVDLKRNRIALSMKSKPDLENRRSAPGDRDTRPQRPGGRDTRNSAAPTNDWFSQALNQAKKK
jgi:hypothetical protein